MEARIRTILISAGTFIGVLLVMCLAAKVMMQDPATQGQAYEQALDKLGGETSDKNTDAAATDSAEPDVNNNGSTDAQEPSDADVNDGRGEGSDAGSAGSEAGISSGTDSGSDTVNADSEDTPAGEPAKTPSKHVVVINAAHQSKDINESEPIGPGATEKKIKCITGATGVSSGVPEYKVNLAIAKYLRDDLVARGYEVYMIRESDDVSISDAERAKLANENGEIVIHIHCNADDAEGIKGIMAFYPSKENAYASKYSDACKTLCNAVLRGLEDATADKNWGAIALDTQTALNWTTIPAAHVEVGYLSNSDEDFLLQTDSYRHTIAAGIADGIDLYFYQ